MSYGAPPGAQNVILVVPSGTPETIVLGAPNAPTPDEQVQVQLTAPLSPNENIQLGPTFDPDKFVALTGQVANTAQGVFNFGGDVTQALTGLAITSTAGTLVPNIDKAFTGLAATTAGGLLTPNIDKAFTGQAATSAQGALTPSIDVALTGLRANSAQGLLTPSDSVTLTGQVATSAQGALGVAIDVPLVGLRANTAQGTITPFVGSGAVLTGFAITSAQGALTPSIDLALTGQRANSAQGALTPSVGSNVTVALMGLRITTAAGSFVGGGNGLEIDLFFTTVLVELIASVAVADLSYLQEAHDLTVTTRSEDTAVKSEPFELVV